MVALQVDQKDTTMVVEKAEHSVDGKVGPTVLAMVEQLAAWSGEKMAVKKAVLLADVTDTLTVGLTEWKMVASTVAWMVVLKGAQMDLSLVVLSVAPMAAVTA